jgi:hypothetical protein
MDFAGILGAAGSIAQGVIAMDAAKSAAAIQNNALDQIRQSISTQMSPDTLQGIATQGDIQRAQQQQKLFSQLFPDLASATTAAQKSLQAQSGEYGPNSQANQVGRAATSDALANLGATQQGQNQLIDAALAQLKAGATLPPDVEAQLVQSGLEASGMVTQNASGKGIGGQQIRTLLGTAGIQLQQQRQQQASGLLAQAQNLETQRQSVLQDLFPRLAQTQLAQTQGAESIFQTGQSAVPQAGLSGTQLANSWLQRIGALNQITAQQAGVNANQRLAEGQIWGNVIGGVTGGVGSSGILSGIGGGGAGAGGVAPRQNPLTASDLTMIER